MSASVGDGNGQDVDLNLAPIIDCFIVLITYLLVTASFLTLSVVDVGVSATGTAPAAAVDPGPPPLVMTLEVKALGNLAILLRGGTLEKELAIEVPPTQPGEWSASALESKLQEIQARFPDLKEVSVSAEPAVMFKVMVAVIHKIQETLPKVFIAS